jgi:hypothetical protein
VLVLLLLDEQEIALRLFLVVMKRMLLLSDEKREIARLEWALPLWDEGKGIALLQMFLREMK